MSTKTHDKESLKPTLTQKDRKYDYGLTRQSNSTQNQDKVHSNYSQTTENDKMRKNAIRQIPTQKPKSVASFTVFTFAIDS